jgi:membrane protein DedA with SNARE-associated domain
MHSIERFRNNCEGEMMDERKYQIIGLLGFIIAGFIFIAAGINFGDILTVLGSVIWVVSCLIWMIPLLKPRKD